MDKGLEQTGGCRRPRIDYPCLWQYTIIGLDAEGIRAAVAEFVGDAPFSLSRARTSRQGRYVSMHLETTVYSDYHRLRFYHELAEHPAVKVIL